jgi:RNA polymerase sigma-70 factor (ECF subfamily)
VTQTLDIRPAGGVVQRASEPRAEFGAFFDQLWPDLVAFCKTLTRDDHLAEEITQETLTRVYVRYPLLSDPRPYAFRVAANLVHRTWKDGRRTEATDPSSLPERQVAHRHDETIDAVRQLPPRLREVVTLHYYADQPVEVVARLLHRPVGTVKRRLHEARARLAIVLKEDLS